MVARHFQHSLVGCTRTLLYVRALSTVSIKMPQNVEVKAKVRDMEALILKAKNLCKCEGTIIEQDDTFFKTEAGRLKLRIFKEGNGELIFYNRPDVEGPKVSDFSKSNSSDPQSLKEVLTLALGSVGRVRKTRLLFMYGQTRIHIDKVVDLGNFMELEVMLKDSQTPEEGSNIAEEVLIQLGIPKSDLISGAYMDWLNNQDK